MLMDYLDNARSFWFPFWTLLTLLGVYLVFLGIALAGLVAAQKRREASASKDCKPVDDVSLEN
jgi:hypothetical protein